MGKTKHYKTKRHGRSPSKKTRQRRRSRSRKTRRRGGGLLSSVVTLRNIGYIDKLEKRLVNKCNDYDWVQEQRKGSLRLKKDKNAYK